MKNKGKTEACDWNSSCLIWNFELDWPEFEIKWETNIEWPFKYEIW